MDRSKLIKITLLVCSACCLIAAISLFAEGDIASGVCGLALAAVLGVIGLRKRASGGKGVAPTTYADYAKTHKVYIEEGGKRYHRDEKCSGMKKPKYVTLEYARQNGYTECKKCHTIK